MKRFEDLISKAGIVGCKKEASAIAMQAQALIAQEKIHIGVIGGQNSGKTTLLNHITNSEIRVPDMLSRKEKPLRIAFEPMENDPICECAELDMPRWRNAQAVFYEIKASDVFKGDSALISPLVGRLDYVIYTVSALAPVTGEDARILDALKDIPVRIVLTKTDLVEDASLETVLQYVSDACEIRGMKPPIVLSGTDAAQDTELIQMGIPTITEIETLRSKHLEMFIRQAKMVILHAAEQALEENQKAWKDALLAIEQDVLKSKHLQADWDGLRADMRVRGLELSNMAAETLMKKKESIIDTLVEAGKQNGFKHSWWHFGARDLTQQLVRQCFEDQTQAMQERLNIDIDFMIRQAKWLGLIQDESTVRQFFIEQPSDYPNKRIERNFKPFIMRRDLWKTVISGNLMLFGSLIIQWPYQMMAAGIIASTILTSFGISREKDHWKEEESRKALTKYIDECFAALILEMKEAITASYGEMVDWMALQSHSLTSKLDDSAYAARKIELNELIASMM